MLNVAVLHKVEKRERRVRRSRFKKPEQRIKEREFHLDVRFHTRGVIKNRPRARERQDLRKIVEDTVYE